MRFVCLFLVACNGGGMYLGSERWAAADEVFHHDPHWLGGDTAASVDLGDDRVLWLFGASYIATTPARTRRESTLIDSSIAVMTGSDPTTASIEHAWSRGVQPGPFFPAGLTPKSGVRLADGSVVIFLAGVGDEHDRPAAVRIADPSGSPAGWTIEPLELPPPRFSPHAIVGSCNVIEGDHLVAVSISGSITRRGRLVRWPLANVGAGDLATREWWTGTEWLAEDALVEPPPVVVPHADDCSLFYDPVLNYEGAWLYVASHGDEIGYRQASRLEGPYDYEGAGAYFDCEAEPPQARMAPGARIIHARAHPLKQADGVSMLATYVDTNVDPEALLDPATEYTLYWPHFAKIWYLEAVE